MAWAFDDDIQVNGDERGDFVFCWARDEGDTDAKPVRVQARRAVVADWGIDWSHKDEVVEAFRARRDPWLARAASAPETGGDFRILVILSEKFEAPPPARFLPNEVGVDEKIVRFPIGSWKRVANRRDKNSVSCIVSDRWLRFPDEATKIDAGTAFFVDVMTDSGGEERKLCSLCITLEELKAVIDKIKTE